MSITVRKGENVISNERLHELADRATGCMDVMGDVNSDEATLVLGMVTFAGCDGKRRRYMTMQENLLKLYPVLKKILEMRE